MAHTLGEKELVVWLNANLDIAEQWFHVERGYTPEERKIYLEIGRIFNGRYCHPQDTSEALDACNCPSAIAHRREKAVAKIQELATANNLTVTIEETTTNE